MSIDADKMMTADDVASSYGLTPSWLKRARAGGYGPPFRLLGHRTVRYYANEVQAWLDSTMTTRLTERKGRSA